MMILFLISEKLADRGETQLKLACESVLFAQKALGKKHQLPVWLRNSLGHEPSQGIYDGRALAGNLSHIQPKCMGLQL